MEVIDFEQMPQHDFDLRVRDEANVDPQMLMKRYYTLLTGVEKDEVSIDDFEKALAGLIQSNVSHVALLNELNFTEVEPLDAAMILKESIVPNDDVLDQLAKLRGDFDQAVDDYTQQLLEAGITLVAPVDPNPSTEQENAARYRLARYVATSVLVDDREETQF
ncbi:hypothetical protein BIZ78_gp159 [Erwinia phage vB_EamM_Caitlin]|uniref:hypothetical protein n=1 Tax=Erwinia phage vB_EamM_Caitlin TaxID=1883379 RepID=UPI00081CF914|nr:hypothetical protein BIZ78_gp159 [Erwinia phage vB_EamM_Caitlin]ANZ48416.1 hypothetical protein CAITLIN_121 [Erwinia phage vB_EamM_Caitlin]